MATFWLPALVASAIDKEVARFIWGGAREGRSIHWRKWRDICNSKFRGGLGLRSAKEMNQALLAKMAWKIVHQPQSLLARFFLNKYCSTTDFLQVTMPATCSWGWKGILWGRDLLTTGIKWKVNQGLIPITSNWIPGMWNPLVFSNLFPSYLHLQVADLFNDQGVWRTPLLEVLFPPAVVQRITQIHISPVQQRDTDSQYWEHEADGKYTVKSGYHQACNLLPSLVPSTSSAAPLIDHKEWRRLWALSLPQKLLTFLWRLLNQAIPTSSALFHRGVRGPPCCQRCFQDIKTIDHLFIQCPISTTVWRASQLGFDFKSGTPVEFSAWFIRWCNSAPDKAAIEESVWLLWAIWLDRNQTVFNGMSSDPISIVAMAGRLHQAHSCAQQRMAREESTHYQPESQRPLTIQRGVQQSVTAEVRIDGAFNQLDGSAGAGWTVRSSSGTPLHIGAKQFRAMSALQAEAMGLLLALTSLGTMGFMSVICLTDSSNLVRLFGPRGQATMEVQQVLADIEHLCQTLTFFSISKVDRTDVAKEHHLAYLARLGMAIAPITSLFADISQ